MTALFKTDASFHLRVRELSATRGLSVELWSGQVDVYMEGGWTLPLFHPNHHHHHHHRVILHPLLPLFKDFIFHFFSSSDEFRIDLYLCPCTADYIAGMWPICVFAGLCRLVYFSTGLHFSDPFGRL